MSCRAVPFEFLVLAEELAQRAEQSDATIVYCIVLHCTINPIVRCALLLFADAVDGERRLGGAADVHDSALV